MMNASWWNIHPFVFTQSLFSFQGTTLWRVLPFRKVVGSSGLEPPTSRLSGARSNHLSYEPIFVFFLRLESMSRFFLRFTLGFHFRLPSQTYGLVEMKGIEPLTPCLQGRCSPS